MECCGCLRIDHDKMADGKTALEKKIWLEILTDNQFPFEHLINYKPISAKEKTRFQVAKEITEFGYGAVVSMDKC